MSVSSQKNAKSIENLKIKVEIPYSAKIKKNHIDKIIIFKRSRINLYFLTQTKTYKAVLITQAMKIVLRS